MPLQIGIMAISQSYNSLPLLSGVFYQPELTPLRKRQCYYLAYLPAKFSIFRPVATQSGLLNFRLVFWPVEMGISAGKQFSVVDCRKYAVLASIALPCLACLAFLQFIPLLLPELSFPLIFQSTFHDERFKYPQSEHLE